MLCPTCNVELKMSDRQGVEIDYCPQCRGVWLDRGELDKIIERVMAQTPGTAPVGYQQPNPPAGPAGRRRDDDDDWRDPYRKRRRRGWFDDLFDFD